MPKREGQTALAVSTALGVAAAALFTAGASDLAGQSFYDSYRVGGRTVPLIVALDSFAVSTPAGTGFSRVEERIRTLLPSAERARDVDERLWVFSTTETTRAELAEAAAALGSDSTSWGGGFLARRADGGEPFVVVPELVVQFAPGTARNVIDAINGGFEAEVAREPPSYRPNQFVVRLRSSDSDALSRSRDYAAMDDVVYAHPNFVLVGLPAGEPAPSTGTSTGTCSVGDYPCDPLYPQQWHLERIDAPDAWNVTIGDPTVTIAVLELGGFEMTHPDLKNKLWDNPYEPADPNDPWAKPGDEHGWNFDGCPGGGGLPPDEDPCGSPNYTGNLDHGTAVAGTAAAQTNNEIGVASVCPRCRLMLIQRGTVTTADLTAQAIDYATSMGADVLNMSFSLSTVTDAVRVAVERAASDGRDSLGIPITVAVQQKPAKYDFCDPTRYLAALESVISVGATTRSDQRRDEGTGACLDLVAPGETIWTTDAGGLYDNPSGTSYAAPIVAGAAGLLISRRTDLSREDVYTCLTQSAEMVGSSSYPDHHNDEFGFGLVDAAGALDMDECASDVDGNRRHPFEPGLEVGVRSGVVVKAGASTESDYGLAGAGPLGAAAVYGSWMPNSAMMFDLHLGLFHRSGTTDRSRVSLALLTVYRATVGAGAIYLGPSIALVRIDDALGTTVEAGAGATLGYHRPLGASLAIRTESGYRRWNGLGLDEWTFGVGLGVRVR